jgi:hypothetical protein
MKLTIDWSKVSSGFKWAAMDEDGRVWLYTSKPVKETENYRFVPANNEFARMFAKAKSSKNNDWQDTLTERPEEPKVEQPEQPTATKHPHADFLAEALKDTARNLEKKLLWDASGKWIPVNLYDVMQHDHTWEFRFADTVKPEVTSPLTDAELCDVWNKSNITAKNVVGYQHQLREIAIAAKIATLKEVAAMPSVTTMRDKALLDVIGMSTQISLSRLEAVANAAIAEFQKRILKQLGE